MNPDEAKRVIAHILEMLEQLPPAERASFEALIEEMVEQLQLGLPGPTSVDEVERRLSELLQYYRTQQPDDEDADGDGS